MARATYIEAPCKSAINAVTGMPFKWSLNPYRGCVHACHYCYARATHAYFGLDADRDFETKIFVKSNLVAVLRKELAKPSWRGEQIAIGTATDAYQPAEGQFRLTRGALEALLAFRNPTSIVTKSTLILRDLDLWASLAKATRVRVYFTITTLDRDLWKRVEPGTPPPAQRLKAIEKLTAAGIPCGVLMAPVLPGLTDSEASIDSVASAAAAHGAAAFYPLPLRLAPLVREHYLNWVEQNAPDLTARYLRAFHGQNLPKPYTERLDALAAEMQRRYGFEKDEAREHDYKQPPVVPPPLRLQLELPLSFPSPA
jgi:DNA repair photolyase